MNSHWLILIQKQVFQTLHLENKSAKLSYKLCQLSFIFLNINYLLYVNKLNVLCVFI